MESFFCLPLPPLRSTKGRQAADRRPAAAAAETFREQCPLREYVPSLRPSLPLLHSPEAMRPPIGLIELGMTKGNGRGS